MGDGFYAYREPDSVARNRHVLARLTSQNPCDLLPTSKLLKAAVPLSQWAKYTRLLRRFAAD